MQAANILEAMAEMIWDIARHHAKVLGADIPEYEHIPEIDKQIVRHQAIAVAVVLAQTRMTPSLN